MPKERKSPFGEWRPPTTKSPFGDAKPARKKPRDPFAKRDDDKVAAEPRETRAPRRAARRQRLQIFLEVAEQGAIAHVPALPGCSFPAANPVQLLRVAVDHVEEFISWCVEERLNDLNPVVEALCEHLGGGLARWVEVVEAERRSAAPLWTADRATPLFRLDYRTLANAEVEQHVRVMRAAARRLRMQIVGLGRAQLAWKPTDDVESLDDLLAHLADHVWWLCSRLDDELEAPPWYGNVEPRDDLLERLSGAIDEAEAFLLAVPESARGGSRVPARLPGADPAERWTHAKVCRRQAEHLRERLHEIPRAVKLAAEA